ncbi:Predicted oxidoreductase [Devosia lucknowensis]|uniref:Predicted oxidoreductase n=1 Tax=Devosia lucknowensis TaxID=1096929 RepID=A0A1Y6ENK7_9HYPH|nr:aldo/keto reductase [Devosia lucknowensis]SMQ62540.1 Predicted oxidoreductase [Devosia lucknowensis]
MKYRYLGRSGLLVSRLCLGTMTFGNDQWGCDQDTSSAIVRRFIEGGGNFIDTADGYSAGESERMLGMAIRDYDRDHLVLATKCWFPTDSAVTARGLSRKHIIDACERSLKRLGTDFIDLYQFHGPDPYTPLEESLRAADDLVRAGKVRYVGCSNFYGWQIAKANTLADAKGYERLISGQHLYNLIRRDIEREILPAAEDAGVGIICWSPLAAGMLSGKYRDQLAPDARSRMGIQASVTVPRYWFEDALKLVEKVADVAQRLGHTPSQVALSWLFGDQRITAAIIGARTPGQVGENLVAGELELPPEIRNELTAALPVNLGYPFEWTENNLRATFGRAEFEPAHTVRLP